MTPPPLLDYIRLISPEHARPGHLASYCDLFTRMRDGEPVRALCTYQIRIWKTETTLHGILWLLEHDPGLNIILMAHSFERVKYLGKRMRELAKRTKVGPVKGWDEIHHWKNEHGGGVLIMSPEMSREGFDCHVLVCDDPIDEDGAAVQDTRELVDRKITYYTARCVRKGKPGPVLIVMSRFHLDDPIGMRLTRKVEKWEHYHKPAVYQDEDGTRHAFAPDVMGLEMLDQTRAVLRESDPNERTWWSRFMGEPRPDSSSYFGEPKRYTSLPEWPGHHDVMGADMSFSRSARADFAATCVGRWYGGQLYMRAMRRGRGELPDFAQLVRDTHLQYGKLPVYSYVSGPERAAIHHLNMLGLPIHAMHAGDPKFVRAQAAIDAHNAGIILWPHEPWVDSVMVRFKKFAGNEQDADDEVDALVSMFNATRVINSNVVPIALGRRRM